MFWPDLINLGAILALLVMVWHLHRELDTSGYIRRDERKRLIAARFHQIRGDFMASEEYRRWQEKHPGL